MTLSFVVAREFDSQKELDAHIANPDEDPVCRVNEGKLLTDVFVAMHLTLDQIGHL